MPGSVTTDYYYYMHLAMLRKSLGKKESWVRSGYIHMIICKCHFVKMFFRHRSCVFELPTCSML